MKNFRRMIDEAVKAEFIKTSENRRRRVNARIRTKFALDFSDQKIPGPESYQVSPCNSECKIFSTQCKLL